MDILLSHIWKLKLFLSDTKEFRNISEILIVLTRVFNKNISKKEMEEANNEQLDRLFNLLKDGGIYIYMDINLSIEGLTYRKLQK